MNKFILISILLFAYFLARSQEFKPITNSTNQPIQNPNYWIGDFDNGIAQISKKGYFGLIDSSGKILSEPKYDFIYEFADGIAEVRLNGKRGLVTDKGKEILNPSDGYIPLPFSEGMAVIIKNKKYGYINKSGEIIVPLTYDDAEPFSNGLAAVRKEVLVKGQQKWKTKVNRYGYINKNGKAVIPFKYTDAKPFNNNRALVRIKRNQLLINSKGRTVKQFDSIYVDGFYKKKYSRARNKEHYGLIDFKGNEVLPFKYRYIRFGLHNTIFVSIGNKWGILNSKFNPITPIEYDEISHIEKNNQFLVKRNGKYGVIDLLGNVIMQCKYDGISFLPNNIVIALTESNSNNGGALYSIYDKNGKKLIKESFNRVEMLTDNLLKVFTYKGIYQEPDYGPPMSSTPPSHIYGVWQILDCRNKKFAFDKYAVIHQISDNLLAVKKLNRQITLDNGRHWWGKEWELIDTTGKSVLPKKYNLHSPIGVGSDTYFHHYFGLTVEKMGLVIVKTLENKKTKYGLMSLTGEIVVPIVYDEMYHSSSNGLIRVKLNNKWGLINTKGNVISQCKYDFIDNLYSGLSLIKVGNDNKYGYIDLTGELIIPIEYSRIEYNFSDGKVLVEKDDKKFYINKNNEVVKNL